MKTIVKLLFLIFIIGCKNQPNHLTTPLPEVKTENLDTSSSESFFDLIINKKESPENFSDSITSKFDFSKRATAKEILALNIDTTKIGLSEYYFLANQKFLKKPIDATSFIIYYKHQNGDQLEKILRIKNKDESNDILLSMEGGDSFSHNISTEFINDSTFISTYVYKDGDLIQSDNSKQESTYEYSYDSIISKYWYNKFFKFKHIQSDTLQFIKQTFYRNQKELWSSLKVYSKPFIFQEKECVWEFIISNYDASSGMLYTQNLVDNKSKEIILKGQADVENYTETITNLYGIRNLGVETKDINFDGFDDISIYNNAKSGTAGEFEDVYIFNKSTGTFEYSDLFSGYNIKYDFKKNRISTYAKNGVGDYYYIYFNLKKNRTTVLFVEKVRHYGDTIFYEKIIDKKSVKKSRILKNDIQGWESYLERK